MIIRKLVSLVYLLCGIFCSSAPTYAFKADAVRACISPEEQKKWMQMKLPTSHYLRQLGWQAMSSGLCYGIYRPDAPLHMLLQDQVQFQAEEVELSANACSTLKGHASVQYNQQYLQADTAYILRDEKTNKIARIELVNHVLIREPGKKIVANYARFYPESKTGQAFDAAYKVDINRAHAILPGWGRALSVWRDSKGLIYLKDASFSTCSPANTAWTLTAKKLALNPTTERGVAKHTTLRIRDIPIFYAPYLSFPISNKRQSGFLTPTFGFSNITGYDFSLPYYWNIAPNYDATIVPHAYSLRGLMMGGEFRYLIPGSNGLFVGNFLPNDQLFAKFLESNQLLYPKLDNLSKNRWSLIWHDQSQLPFDIGMKVDYQKVSDDYYLQDFSTNLAVMTENQILRQGALDYRTDHWYIRSMLQSYQTLQPINQSFVTQLYARQPQVFAQGNYDRIFEKGNFQFIGQYDQFAWTGTDNTANPEGPRFHLNPAFSIPMRQSWGYVQPQIELLSNLYQLSNGTTNSVSSYSMALPRYSIDSGIFLDRNFYSWQQTLEPRLYYLYVPYQNQTVVPAFESAYMIFNSDQLFRPNRFSGYDRIGDTNQFSYSLSSRLLNPDTGEDKLLVTVGQIAYLQNRKLNLCYAPDGQCQDTSLYLGYTSPTTTLSPVASRGVYSLTRDWSIVGNYIYDVNANTSNNADLNLHYQPSPDRVVHLGYGYLVNGNVITGLNAPIDEQALNQLSAAYAWPFIEKWSSLAAYSYNISNSYAMVMFGGIQYDSCCWAFRLMGGRTFQSLEPQTLQPQYNNSIYFQVLLKGIGSAANSDPATTIQTYLPGLYNIFKH